MCNFHKSGQHLSARLKGKDSCLFRLVCFMSFIYYCPQGGVLNEHWMQTDEANFTDLMLIPPSNLMEEISPNLESSQKILNLKKESFLPVLKNFERSIKMNVGHTCFFISYLKKPAFLSRVWKVSSLIFIFLELFDFEWICDKHIIRQHVELREHENSDEFLIHSNFLLSFCCSKVHEKAQNLQKQKSLCHYIVFLITASYHFGCTLLTLVEIGYLIWTEHFRISNDHV